MKRLLLVVLMVLVTLVGMVGFSAAGNAVSVLQSTTNPTIRAIPEQMSSVNSGVPVKPKMYYLTQRVENQYKRNLSPQTSIRT